MLRMTRMTSRAHFPSSRSPEPRTMTSSRRLAALLALAGAIASPRGARAVVRQTHQASVTFTAAGPEGASAGVGDLALNYRLQAIGNGETRVALSPRLTVLVPTGDSARGLGSGGTGLQLNVPLSVVLLDRLVTHVNVGATYVPSDEPVEQ